MKLQLIYSITAPQVTGVDADDAYYSEPMEEFRDKVEEFMKKSDIVKGTTKKGEELFLAAQNFRFGTCDCCSTGEKQDVIRYDFYKVE